MKREHIPLLAMAVLVLVIFGAVLSSMARAHPWMTLPGMNWCCNERDCKPQPRGAVERVVGGWRIKSTGQVFPDGDGRLYPNLRPDLSPVWICHMPTEPKARCLMVSPEGS